MTSSSFLNLLLGHGQRGKSSAPDSSPPDLLCACVWLCVWLTGERTWYDLQSSILMPYNCTIPSSDTIHLVSWYPCRFRTSALNGTLNSTGNPYNRCPIYTVLCIPPATDSSIPFCSGVDNNSVGQLYTCACYNHSTIPEDNGCGDCRYVGC